MKIGTKSVLFGAHCFLLHPFFVLAAWIKLFGFPFDPRLWIAFFVHDLGYWGKPNMDGPEGETHVELGAKIMAWLFDRKCIQITISTYWKSYEHGQSRSNGKERYRTIQKGTGGKWADFARYHSRFYAKKDGVNPSKLCIADKLAICLTPAWLYIPMTNWSGEIYEYMKLAESRNLAGEPTNKYESMKLATKSQKDWYDAVQSYILRWVEEHKDGKTDTWTPNNTL
jgi:hypothetical protein